MERLTRRENGAVTVAEGAAEAALERLARFEDLAVELVEEHSALVRELEQLREQNKTKTVRYREMVGQKLLNGSMLDLLERHGLR